MKKEKTFNSLIVRPYKIELILKFLASLFVASIFMCFYFIAHKNGVIDLKRNIFLGGVIISLAFSLSSIVAFLMVVFANKEKNEGKKDGYYYNWLYNRKVLTLKQRLEKEKNRIKQQEKIIEQEERILNEL
jgi:hypothetical protein